MRSSGVSPHKRYGARLEFGCKTSEGWSEQRDGHSLVSTGEARRPERARCALGWQRPLEEGVRLRVLRAALGRWKRETLVDSAVFAVSTGALERECLCGRVRPSLAEGEMAIGGAVERRAVLGTAVPVAAGGSRAGRGVVCCRPASASLACRSSQRALASAGVKDDQESIMLCLLFLSL